MPPMLVAARMSSMWSLANFRFPTSIALMVDCTTPERSASSIWVVLPRTAFTRAPTASVKVTSRTPSGYKKM